MRYLYQTVNHVLSYIMFFKTKVALISKYVLNNNNYLKQISFKLKFSKRQCNITFTSKYREKAYLVDFSFRDIIMSDFTHQDVIIIDFNIFI